MGAIMKVRTTVTLLLLLSASFNAAAYNTVRELAVDLESVDRAARVAAEYWINGVLNGAMMVTKYKYRCVRFNEHRDAVRKYLAKHPERMSDNVPEGVVLVALWTAGYCPAPDRVFSDATSTSRLNAKELQEYNQQIEDEHECLLAKGRWLFGRCVQFEPEDDKR
jgi:hypothetical protein